jgi:phosphatidylserine decarboxylase
MSVRLDPAGIPFVVAAGILVAVGWAAIGWLAALPLGVLAAFFLFFFRDPDRRSPVGDDLVLSPADGRVLVAGRGVAGSVPPGDWQQVSIFLSPMDVHVNRIPASGHIMRVDYKPGRFLPAYRHEASASNERCEIWIDHQGRTVVARQVVGILARRVICRVKPGDAVQAGDRYGIMKFGSRMDVFLPLTAEIRVSVGDAVRGGETVIAVVH